MIANRPCGTTLSPEKLEQQLKQIEQKIVSGEADSDAFENFIVYQLERRQRTLGQSSTNRDSAQS